MFKQDFKDNWKLILGFSAATVFLVAGGAEFIGKVTSNMTDGPCVSTACQQLNGLKPN